MEPVHLDRSDWVPDFTDPETKRPTKKELKKMTKAQVEAYNQLCSMHYKRSLDGWFRKGGYFTKYLSDVELD